MEISNLILWSDSTLVAVNKPAGLLTIADGYNPTLPYLSQMLQSLFEKVWVIHRLDKDTSGVLLFALNAEAHQHLNRQFQLRETSKEYHALVLGNPDWEHKTISLPLIVNGDRDHRTVVNLSAGKPATTEATLL